MTLAMLPSTSRYIEKLPQIKLRNLSEDHKQCTICMDAFASDPVTEKPVKLHCGHIFGNSCIRTWVSSADVSRPTCPICRASLTPEGSLEQWELYAFQMQHEPFISMSQTLGYPPDSNKTGVEVVLLYYRVVVFALKACRKNRVSMSAVLSESAQIVAWRMGGVFEMMKGKMQLFGMEVPWDERGPLVDKVLDLEHERYFESHLERMLHVEQMMTH